MEQEVAILRNQMENCETFHHAGSVFFSGFMHGHEVILIKCGIGKVAAAIGTTLMLENFQPDCIINTGSAGGFDPTLNVGDIVVSTEVRHHDVDVTAFGYEIGQLPGLPPAFRANEKLVEIATSSAEAVGHVQTKQGLVCTGDIFMADAQKVEHTRESFPTMLACEMEGAAIAQVCHQFDIPFVITRSLSDIAGKEAPSSFDSYLEQASEHSSKMVIKMLDKMQELTF